MNTVEFVQSLYAAFGRGDLETIIQGVSTDVEWREVGRPEDFPAYGQRRGPDQVREFFAIIGREIDFLDFSPKELVPAGDRVFVFGHSLAEVKRTGRRVDTDWIHAFRIAGGKVVKFDDFADTAQFAQAYAAVPELVSG